VKFWYTKERLVYGGVMEHHVYSFQAFVVAVDVVVRVAHASMEFRFCFCSFHELAKAIAWAERFAHSRSEHEMRIHMPHREGSEMPILEVTTNPPEVLLFTTEMHDGAVCVSSGDPEVIASEMEYRALQALYCDIRTGIDYLVARDGVQV
jgi:hypothetical protein